MVSLRDKEYERGWLKEHDSQAEREASAAIDLRKFKSKQIMNDILKFNQMLFRQLSASNEVNLQFENAQKNYLLVPLSLIQQK